MGRRVVVAELIYRTSYTKEVSSIIGFFNIHLKTFSRYDNLEVVRLFLAQGGNILETFPGPRGRSGVGGGGGTPYNGLYVEAPPKRNTLFGLHVYKRVGIY